MHYALFISFFQKMEGMIPSFIPKRTVSVQEVLPSPQGFGLQMIQLGSKLGLFLAWGRELGSADSQHKASLFRSHYWQSSKLLFCGHWDNHNWLSVP